MNIVRFEHLIIAILVIVILFLTQCGGEPEVRTITVKVPEIIGQTDTVYVPKPYSVTVPVFDTIYELSPQPIRDSLYYDLATIREYSNKFTDENQSITTYSKVKGHLLEQSNQYHIFEREVQTQIEIKPSNALFLSGGVRGRFQDFEPVGVLKLTLINKKNNILYFETATDKSFGVGYGIKF